jgi:TonB family protein
VVKPRPTEPKQKKEPKAKQEKPKTPPKQETPRVTDKPKITDKVPQPPKDKPKIDIDLTVIKTQPDEGAERHKLERLRAAKEAKEEADRQARAQKEAIDLANKQYKETQQALGTIVGNVQNKMSSGTVVEMPGPGGEAFINYADLIWTKYYQAWQRPEDHEVRSPVKVEIVVNRDGRIVSANIVSPSGDASMDKSVRQVLDRVRNLPPFPEGAKDPQRKFTIQFILKSKRSFG